MGFLTNLISSTIKVGLSPLAIIKDGVDVISGNEPNNTKELLKSGVKDFDNSINTKKYF
jgi:hypothetical protein